MTRRELVMYARTTGCPYQSIAARVFVRYEIPHRIIWIDQDDDALRRVVAWTGFRSVPTLVVAEPGEVLPYEEPEPITGSPRGIDRGAMLTEATEGELVRWLIKHGFLSDEDVAG